MSYFKKELIPELTNDELNALINHCEYFKKGNKRELRRYEKKLKELYAERRKRNIPKPEKVTFT